MATSELPTPGEIRFRFEQVDREIADVRSDVKEIDEKGDHRDAVVATILQKIAVIEERQTQLGERMKGVTTALWGVAVAFITVAFSVLAAAGKFG